MKHLQVRLNKHYSLEYNPTLECFISDALDVNSNKPRKAIIIIPGGGYDFVSKREGDPIAFAFLSQGYNAFILNYTVDPINHSISYPTPQLQLLAAFDYIRTNAKKLHIDPNKVCAIGFSAGGHLLAAYSYKYKEIANLINVKQTNGKPNAICLAYPVITLLDNTHQGTADNITGKKKELYEELSPHLHINKDYPPTFLWSTKEDSCVPVINTELMDKALSKVGVKHQTIIYPHGDHGLSLATEFTTWEGTNAGINKEVATWQNKCNQFFKKVLKER